MYLWHENALLHYIYSYVNTANSALTLSTIVALLYLLVGQSTTQMSWVQSSKSYLETYCTNGIDMHSAPFECTLRQNSCANNNVQILTIDHVRKLFG